MLLQVGSQCRAHEQASAGSGGLFYSEWYTLTADNIIREIHGLFKRDPRVEGLFAAVQDSDRLPASADGLYHDKRVPFEESLSVVPRLLSMDT